MIAEAYTSRQFFSEPFSEKDNISLSLFISKHAFAYVIFTDAFVKPVELCSVALESTSSDLSTQVAMLMDNHQLLKKKFSKVNIAYLGSDFAMVPAAFAEGSADKDILNFSTGKNELRVLRQTLGGIRFIYGMDAELFNYLERSFPNAALRHAGIVGMGLFAGHHALAAADIYVDLSEGLLQIIARQNKQLSFYNVFDCSANEDVLYYLLFTMEQLGLDPLQIKLAISCDRPVKDALLELLATYIKHLSFAVPHPSLQLNGKFSELPSHFNFTLLNQHLCES